MPILALILMMINFSLSAYLIFLFYQRAKTSNKNNQSLVNANLSQCLQKISLTRFNPFNQVGGDQSFILTLLDNDNSGVIITSLHNRDHTRVYAKEIRQGQGYQTSLSTEEKAALKKILKS